MKKIVILILLLSILIPISFANTITLREKPLKNNTLFFINLANSKYYRANIDEHGNFNFTIQNLTDNIESNELIQIQICNKDTFSYNIVQKENYPEINTYCVGIIGHFNIIKEIENLKIELNPEYIFGDQVGNQVEFKCMDKHLTFCSIILANGFTILNYQVAFIKNDSGEHKFNIIPLYNLSEDVYSLSLLASDGLNPILSVNQFRLEIVDITNPYNLPAEGNFEINESDCFFVDNGKKSINLSYKPNEKKKITISCPEKGSLQIHQNFILKTFINLGNVTLSFIGSMVFYLIIYLIHNPKSTKKLFTKKLLLLFIIIWISLYLLLQYLKFNF